MTAHPKHDFRKKLNFILEAYYHYNQPVFIHKKFADNNIPIPYEEVTAAFKLLLKDGHIEQIAPGYSAIPLATVSAQGRVFFEAGGYKDDTTRLDKMIKWVKNHKVFSWVILLFIGLTSITGIIGIILQLIKLFKE